MTGGTATCFDCQRDITAQDPAVTKANKVKEGALLCRACGKQRERNSNGGILEDRRKTPSGTEFCGTEVVLWETSDGKQFTNSAEARGYQWLLGLPRSLTSIPGPGQANAASPHPAPTATLMGVLFIMTNGGTKGEFWWSDADQAWIVNQDTYDAMRAGSNTEVQRQIAELRKARMEGRDVVAGRVTNNPRRPQAAPRQRKGDLTNLAERTKRMVVQIASMSDKGAIPDGQVAELSKTYAALQAEFDEAMGCAEAIKDNLSIMRAIMFEHSDPRNARDAIA